MLSKMFFGVSAAVTLLLGAFAPAAASPIDVTYTVSGSAGNWLYDFSVTNNLGGANQVYIFGVKLGSVAIDGISGSPSTWIDLGAATSVLPLNNAGLGGSSIDYWDYWRNGHANFDDTISSGQTLSGFKVLDTSQTLFTTAAWFAFSLNQTGASPTTGCFDCNNGQNLNFPMTQSGFESTASATPLPAALPLFSTGLGALGLLGWRRKRRKAAAFTVA